MDRFILKFALILSFCPGILTEAKTISNFIHGRLTRNNNQELNVIGMSTLYLNNKGLTVFPADLVNKYKDTLEILILSHNNIKSVRKGDIPVLKKLHTLYLDHNGIEEIDYDAFENLPGLFTLSLSDNNLAEFPHLTGLSHLRTLDLANNRLEELEQESFSRLRNITDLFLQGNRIIFLRDEVLEFNHKIENLVLDNNPLSFIADKALMSIKNLRSLSLRGSKLTKLSGLGLENLHILDLGGSLKLWRVPDPEVFVNLQKITMPYDTLCCLFEETSTAKHNMDYRSCKDDDIDNSLDQNGETFVNDSAWRGMDLDMEPPITSPPTRNESIQQKRVTKDLKIDPLITFNMLFENRNSPKRTNARRWKRLKDKVNETKEIEQERIKSVEKELRKESKGTTERPTVINSGGVATDSPFWDLMEQFNGQPDEAPKCSKSVTLMTKITSRPRKVTCLPRRNLFTPCGYLLGPTPLRIVAWIVSIVALFGNTAMMFVLCFQREDISSYRLFIFNLGLVNILIGAYIVILSSVDIITGGQHYKFAMHWQYGTGCRNTGFLAVYGSQTTVLLLVGITMERYSLIVRALEHDRYFFTRLSRVWTFVSHMYGLLMAALPAAGHVGSYNHMAICLPVESQSPGSFIYFVMLSVVNGGSFTFVLLAYLKIFWTVRESGIDVGVRKEYSLAKRIILILASHFAAWMPLIVIGALEIAYPGSMQNFKVGRNLVVIFLPMNAFVSPFLYFFCTKLFERDFGRRLNIFCFGDNDHTRRFQFGNFAPAQLRRAVASVQGITQRFRDEIFAARVEVEINPIPSSDIHPIVLPSNGSSRENNRPSAEGSQMPVITDGVVPLDTPDAQSIQSISFVCLLMDSSNNFSDSPSLPILESSPTFSIPLPFDEHSSIIIDQENISLAGWTSLLESGDDKDCVSTNSGKEYKPTSSTASDPRKGGDEKICQLQVSFDELESLPLSTAIKGDGVSGCSEFKDNSFDNRVPLAFWRNETTV